MESHAIEDMDRDQDEANVVFEFLAVWERKQLTKVLARLALILTGGAEGRVTFLMNGLQGFIELLPVNATANVFASRLVVLAEGADELLSDPAGYHPLGAVINAVLQLEDAPRNDRLFLGSLILKYALVGDPAYVVALQKELGINPAVTPWQKVRRAIPATHSRELSIPTIKKYLQGCIIQRSPQELSPAVKKLYEQKLRIHVPDNLTNEGTDPLEVVHHKLCENGCDARLRRIVILGDPGAGKTALLRHLQAQQAQKSLTKLEANDHQECLIPVLIRLEDLQTGMSIPDLLRDRFNEVMERVKVSAAFVEITTNQVNELLRDYKCLLLFDGLESVSQEGGIQRIDRFMERHPEHYYLVSCRTTSYRGQLGASIPTLFVADLNDQEVEAVLGAKEYHRLNEALRPLVRNRALLQIVLTSGESLAGIRSKGQLWRVYYRRLLTSGKGLESPSLSPDMLELFLERLAFDMLKDRVHAYSEFQMMQVAQNHIEEWNEPYSWRQLADALRHGEGLLSRDELRQWSFRNQTAQACFAAAALLQKPDRIKVVLENVHGIWWRDTLSLLIGLQRDPTELCYQLIDQDIYVAATCIRASGREVDSGVIEAVIDSLIEQVLLENSQDRRRIIMLLGESQHPRAIDALLQFLEREWSSYVLSGIVRSIAAWVKNDPSQPLTGYLKKHGFSKASQELIGRCVSLLVLGKPSAGDVDYYAAIVKDPQRTPRARGLAAIGLGFCQLPAARDALLELFDQPQTNTFVGWCIVEGLTNYDDEVVLQVARRYYQMTRKEVECLSCETQRAQAVYLLGWLKKEDKTTKILTQALRDKDAETRGYAVYAMARLDLIGTREELEALLSKEEDPGVLRKIAEALGEIGDLNSVRRLEDVLHGGSARTRRTVQRAILRIHERNESQYVAN